MVAELPVATRLSNRINRFFLFTSDSTLAACS